MYPGKQERLSLTILTSEADRRRHGGYRYLITTPTFSHCAFRTKAGLRQWLRDTGLQIGPRIKHLWHTRPLLGHYYDDMMGDEQAFAQLRQSGQWREARAMSNGDYTRAVITWDNEGVNTIHYLNPNCRREVLPYREVPE